MNTITIQGNLTKDPEFNYLPSGLPVAKITIADNSYRKVGEEKKQEVIFWQVQFFGTTAETIGNTLSKGKKITVVGTAVPNIYTDKNGVERHEIRINAQKFEYCDRKDK